MMYVQATAGRQGRRMIPSQWSVYTRLLKEPPPGEPGNTEMQRQSLRTAGTTRIAPQLAT